MALPCYKVCTGIRVVSTLGRFGPGRFGQFLGWVISALVGGSSRPIFEVSHFGPGLFLLIYDRDRRADLRFGVPFKYFSLINSCI